VNDFIIFIWSEKEQNKSINLQSGIWYLTQIEAKYLLFKYVKTDLLNFDAAFY